MVQFSNSYLFLIYSGSIPSHAVSVLADYAGYADVSAMFMQLGDSNIIKVVSLWLTLI